MLMNANTATRSFRELQFDLKEFLEAFSKLCPVEGVSEDRFVEVHWADGSIDLVPTFSFISGLVGNYFKKLVVSGVSEIVPYQGTTLSVEGSGLSGVFTDLESPSGEVTFNGGYIKSLEADVVELGQDVHLTSLEQINPEYSEISVLSLFRIDRANIGNAYINRAFSRNDISVTGCLDISRVQPSCSIPVPRSRSDYSVEPLEFVHTTEYAYSISGPLRYSYDVVDIPIRQGVDSEVYNNIPVYLEVPYVSSFKLGKIEYSYARIDDGTTVPYNIMSPLPDDSSVSLAMIYPYKYKRSNLVSDPALLGVTTRLLAPNDDDKGKIFNIQNTSSSPIKVCNVWQFSVSVLDIATSVVGRVPGEESNEDIIRGSVYPLNYVNIPAYSNIDFLFDYDYMGGNKLRVCMLPMRRLP